MLARISREALWFCGKQKIGNLHLKWAFSEAAVLFLRCNPEGLEYKNKLASKHGKGKALAILSHKLGANRLFHA